MKQHSDYTIPGIHNLKTPSREEFHKYAIAYISQSDFCTDFPGNPGRIAEKIAKSINWTKNQARQNYFGGWKHK